MRRIRRILGAVAVTIGMTIGTGANPALAITQLGFALDASGSVSTSDYNLLRSGLNAALGVLPADGTVEITVVSYGSGVLTVVPPTILTGGVLSTIQSAISSHAKDGGGTDTGGAITSLANLIVGSGIFALPDTRSIINLATDGFPNSQSAAETAAQNAFSAGIDAMSIEAIGSGVSSSSALNDLAQIAFPGPVAILPVNSTNIPNPLGGSFVVPVSDFDSLEPVLRAKVTAAVTTVPEPPTMMLLGMGLALLVAQAARRAKG